MAKGCSSNNYEEARKKRLEENKKRHFGLCLNYACVAILDIAETVVKCCRLDCSCSDIINLDVVAQFEDLGISKILTKVTSPAKKSQNRLPRLKLKTNEEVEPRRSSRPRNQVTSYTEENWLTSLAAEGILARQSRVVGSHPYRAFDRQPKGPTFDTHSFDQCHKLAQISPPLVSFLQRTLLLLIF
ncbi:B3 domain-containing protein [Trifolium pratense]|uniref:B3 domain-containing protein n=1 Tax=Trifolium pratense TaxID=57577 RepID=A0A2K3MRR8_TRIPR|nr:B3 domain-containing protein [Trifolium pratense]